MQFNTAHYKLQPENIQQSSTLLTQSHFNHYKCCMCCRIIVLVFITLQSCLWCFCRPPAAFFLSFRNNLKEVIYCDMCNCLQTLTCIVLYCGSVVAGVVSAGSFSRTPTLTRHTHIHRCRQSTAWRNTAIWPTTEHAQKTPDFDHEPNRRTIVLLKPWHHPSPRVQIRTQPGDGVRPPQCSQAPLDPAELDQGGISNVSPFVVGVLSTRLWRWRRSLCKEEYSAVLILSRVIGIHGRLPE